MEEMTVRARRAVDKLRFVCPIIACTIETDGETLRWVYTPSADRDAWLDLAFFSDERPGTSLNSSDFVQCKNLTRLPYTDGTGTATHFRVYLLAAANGRDDVSKEYGLYFQHAHSMMDAGPALHALNLMCEWMSGNGIEVSITPLEEWKNLPVDPITATGRPMTEEWQTSGRPLLQYFREQKNRTAPCITLAPPSRLPDMAEPPLRRTLTLSKAETAAIVAQTKRLGLSVTALFYAANALAQLKINPIAEAGNEVDLSQDDTALSLERYIKPPINPKTHLISCSALIPVRFSMARPLMEPTEKGRLIKTAKAVQEQFKKYLTNPCLPQLMVATMADKEEAAQTVKNTSYCRVVNLGVLEDKVKTDHGPIIVESVDLGNRRKAMIAIHVWTMRSKLHFLIQGAAAWGDECLKTVLEETVRIGSLVLDKQVGKL